MKTRTLFPAALVTGFVSLSSLFCVSQTSAQVGVTNISLPVVTIRATDPAAREPGVLPVIDLVIFTVTRSRGTNVDMTVYYSVGGTASNGVDYTGMDNLPLPGAVVIPKGELSAQIVLYPQHDALPEGTETVVIKILPVACIAVYPPPENCYQVGQPSEATAYILDNDLPNQPPAVRIVKPINGQIFQSPANIGIVAETVDTDGFTWKVEFFADNVKLGEQIRYFTNTPPPGQCIPFEFCWTNAPVGQHVLTARATDDQAASGISGPVAILVCPTNQPPTNLPPIVNVVAVDPVAAEGTNCLRWPGYSPCLKLSDCLSCWTTNACKTNTATFVVRRTGATNQDLTVTCAIGGTASNGVDYVELASLVTIPAGRRWVPVVVVPIDDLLPERIETVVLRLMPSPLDVFPPPYYIGNPARAGAIIVDNDQPRPPVCILPDRSFHLRWPGSNGQWFRIECSTNLVHWMPICTNIVTDGAVHFVDLEAEHAPSRFYRAVPEPNPPSLE